jgi:hypothetical protein
MQDQLFSMRQGGVGSSGGDRGDSSICNNNGGGEWLAVDVSEGAIMPVARVVSEIETMEVAQLKNLLSMSVVSIVVLSVLCLF